MDMSWSKLNEIVKDGEAWRAAVPWGHRESDTTKKQLHSVCSISGCFFCLFVVRQFFTFTRSEDGSRP